MSDDTLLVNRKKYNELKAKAELYDAVLKEHAGMLGCRGSSFYHDFVGFMETLKTAKLGKLTLYISRAGELVILPKEKHVELTKENELLKEIIKSLFDQGCPLHQYIDKDFGLTIEVDSECSIMHLGKYKGIDLDEYLKEVLK